MAYCKLIIGFSVFLLTACGGGPIDQYEGKSNPQTDSIKEVELSPRTSSDSNDPNFFASQLFLTDYDRAHNQAVLMIQIPKSVATEKLDSRDLTISSVCMGDGSCGLVRSETSFESVNLDEASKEVRASQLRASSKLSSVSQTSSWILSIETSYVLLAPKWKITVALELGPSETTGHIKARYRVLEYKKL